MCTSIHLIFFVFLVLNRLKEPKNVLRVHRSLKPPLWSQKTTNHIHSSDYVWYLQIGHPLEENQQRLSIFFKKKQTSLKSEWRNSLHY